MTDAEAIEVLSRWVLELRRENETLHHTLRHCRITGGRYWERMQVAEQKAALLNSKAHRYWVDLAAELDPAAA